MRSRTLKLIRAFATPLSVSSARRRTFLHVRKGAKSSRRLRNSEAKRGRRRHDASAQSLTVRSEAAMRAVLVASVLIAAGAAAALAQPDPSSSTGAPMQPEASPRSEAGVPAIEATSGASAPYSASANPILRVPVSGLHPGNVSFTPKIVNPLAQDPQTATRGMQDFIQFNCVGCHAPNAGGGMGPALSEGRFIYGSSSANLFLSIYQGRPNGMPTWARHSTRVQRSGSLSPMSKASPIPRAGRLARRPRERAGSGRRADAGGVPADGESLELHDDLQRRQAAGRRMI